MLHVFIFHLFKLFFFAVAFCVEPTSHALGDSFSTNESVWQAHSAWFTRQVDPAEIRRTFLLGASVVATSRATPRYARSDAGYESQGMRVRTYVGATNVKWTLRGRVEYVGVKFAGPEGTLLGFDLRGKCWGESVEGIEFCFSTGLSAPHVKVVALPSRETWGVSELPSHLVSERLRLFVISNSNRSAVRLELCIANSTVRRV